MRTTSVLCRAVLGITMATSLRRKLTRSKRRSRNCDQGAAHKNMILHSPHTSSAPIFYMYLTTNRGTSMKLLILILLSAFLLASAYAAPTLICNPYPAVPSNPSGTISTFSLFFDGSTSPAVVNQDGTQVLQFNLNGLPLGTHTVYAEAINMAGVTSPASSPPLTFNLGDPAPVISFSGLAELVKNSTWPFTEILSGTMDFNNYSVQQFDTSDGKTSYVLFSCTGQLSNTEGAQIRITIRHPNSVQIFLLDLVTMSFINLPLVVWDNGQTAKADVAVTSHPQLLIVQ
jgi:hypothetical protein